MKKWQKEILKSHKGQTGFFKKLEKEFCDADRLHTKTLDLRKKQKTINFT